VSRQSWKHQNAPARWIPDRNGSALLGSVLLTIVLSMLATVSLNVAVHEIEATSATHEELNAQNLAESAGELVLAWFHDPRATPEGPVGKLFNRLREPDDLSFRDGASRVSPFTGTSEAPDVWLDATRPEHDQLLNDPQKGWFRALAPLGRLMMLKLYGPARPGLLCTIEAYARSGNVSRLIRAELGARHIPPLRSGIFLRIMEPTGLVRSEAPYPVWLHWGDLTARGDLNLGNRSSLVSKTVLAANGEQSYTDMPGLEDRWLDFWLGGRVLLDGQIVENGLWPAHVHPGREPSPGLEGHQWDYETMKRQAMLYGLYYVPDVTGALRLNGMPDAKPLTASEVLQSAGIGDHRGLVFIDTLDQQQPRSDNLATLTLETEYSEGLFIVNGHLHWKPKGSGKSVPALSPPPEGSSSIGTRIPVQLSGIHLQGVLSVAGHLTYEGNPRLYGALLVDGAIVMSDPSSRPVEVWYNHDLRAGLMRGMPLVYVAPGTWYERY
jgi:hypothetical protein